MKKTMEYLLKLIAKDGSSKTAGIWLPNQQRDDRNKGHYHSPAFYHEIYPTVWWKQQGIELDTNESLERQLPILGEQGMIAIENLKANRARDGKLCYHAWVITPAIDQITPLQRQVLESLYEEIQEMGKEYITISCIRNYDAMDIEDFYEVDQFYQALRNIEKGKEK